MTGAPDHARKYGSAIPFPAIGRLNSHARVPYSTARNAIYSYKTLAALIAVVEGMTTPRFIKWAGKCNRCENGRFTHWSWDDGYSVRCRDCGGTGSSTLRFVETDLPDGQTWHHPWSGGRFPQPGKELAEVAGVRWSSITCEYAAEDGSPLEWQDCGDWRPLLPGEKLPLRELVDLLNEVEDWVDDLSPPPSLHWPSDRAKRNLYRHPKVSPFDASEYRGPSDGYSLGLGRAPGGCFVCGEESDLAGHCFGRMTSHFHWSLPVCNAHSKSPFPTDPPPEALITPAIRRWLDRHSRMMPT